MITFFMQFLTRFQNVEFDFSIFPARKTLVIGFEMTLVGLEGKVTTNRRRKRFFNAH